MTSHTPAELETLPSELKVQILKSLPDVETLEALIRASPVYHALYAADREERDDRHPQCPFRLCEEEPGRHRKVYDGVVAEDLIPDDAHEAEFLHFLITRRIYTYSPIFTRVTLNELAQRFPELFLPATLMEYHLPDWRLQRHRGLNSIIESFHRQLMRFGGIGPIQLEVRDCRALLALDGIIAWEGELLDLTYCNVPAAGSPYWRQSLRYYSVWVDASDDDWEAAQWRMDIIRESHRTALGAAQAGQYLTRKGNVVAVQRDVIDKA
ncbi:MAG: hypothetical protein Q9191_000764 [Dirinaria sp. TL-2023a]